MPEDTQQPQQPQSVQPKAKAQTPTQAALRKSSTLVLTLASALQHRPGNGDSTALECCRAALSGEQPAARLVSEIKDMRLRQGDDIVVCSPDRSGAMKLSEPLKVDEHWDATLLGGAGGIVSSSFFSELAKRAAPLTVKRRTDENGMFWLDWA